MKWNGRPDPGEPTQCRVHGNEGHSLPRDAGVRRKGLVGPGQALPQAELKEQSGDKTTPGLLFDGKE